MNLVAGEEGSGWGEAEARPAMEGRPTAVDLAEAFVGRVVRERPGLGYRLALGWGVATALLVPGVYALWVVGWGWGLFWVGEDWLAWVKSGEGGMLTRGVKAGIYPRSEPAHLRRASDRCARSRMRGV